VKQTLQTIGHWTPFAFCTLISLSASRNLDEAWGMGVFLSFLPMSFFFVGAATWQMQKEVRELRKQVMDLRAKQVSSLAVA
jgi:hypothetical protein